MPSFTVYKGSKDGKVVKSETSKGELTGDQVLVKVTASGLYTRLSSLNVGSC